MKIDYDFLINKISDSCEVLEFAVKKDPLLMIKNESSIIKLTELNEWLINELTHSKFRNENNERIITECIKFKNILNNLKVS
ncbi:hypothetical protein [Aliivibrio logei]|uniref:Uncharacterized protein n=1 Tax=Aliivibrio logei TaxID=688 RepID=A0A1B9NTW6_ALILO|nr:hypothetical protein [Aliivibrio logei]OCH17079.1 hypothetical protein A6E04_19700 [Aliivibrio logei]